MTAKQKPPTYNAVGMRGAIQQCAGDPPRVQPEPGARLWRGKLATLAAMLARSEGQVLVVAVGAIIVVGIAVASMSAQAVATDHAAVQDRDRQAAQTAADGGINLAVSQLHAGEVPDGVTQVGDAEVRWSGYVETAGWLLTATATVGGSTAASRAVYDMAAERITWLG